MRSPSQGRPAQDEEVRSVRYLTLGDNAALDEVVTFVKLLPNPAPIRRISSASEDASAIEAVESVGKSLILVVGTASGRTYVWDVDPAAAPVATKVCAVDGSCVDPLRIVRKVSVEQYSARIEAHERAGAPLSIAATAAFATPAYTIVSRNANTFLG